MTHDEVDDVIKEKAAEPDPVIAEYIHRLKVSFSTPAILKLIENDEKNYDRRDRELIPEGWTIEETYDYLNDCSVILSKNEGDAFEPGEVAAFVQVVQEIERTYWLMTRRRKR